MPRPVRSVLLAGALTCLLYGQQEIGTQPGAGTSTVEKAPGYVLGAGDQLMIWALGMNESFDKPFKVDESGYVDLPLLGRLRAQGCTIEEFKDQLMKGLRRYVTEPQTSVSVVETRSQPVSIVGAVNNPGVHQLQGRKTLMEMISAAGGLRADAGKSVNITRRPPGSESGATADAGETIEVSVRELLDGNSTSQNVIVRPHDVITVPRAQMVYVAGEVKKAGGFVLDERESMSVMQALALASGVTPTAATGYARIFRAKEGSNEPEEIKLDLKRLLSLKMKDPLLFAGDILFVPNSAAKAVSRKAMDAALQVAIGLTIWRR